VSSPDGAAPDGVPGPAGASEYPDHYRAGDADRQRTADRLRAALDDGRLTLLEYDERLGQAYGAQTYGELAALTRDLPEPGTTALPASEPPTAVAKRSGVTRDYLVHQGRSWLAGAVVTNGIWAFTSPWQWHEYWPGVVMLIWALSVLVKVIKGEPRREEEQRQAQSRRRQARLERNNRRRELRRGEP
jgi:hypothetical protein